MEPETNNSREEAEDKITEKIEAKERRYFVCDLCSLRVPYDYFGKEPSFSRKYKLSEDSYVIEDPFEPPKIGEILVLGSHCKQCRKSVCKDSNCSVYFDGSFCINCAKNNRRTFPAAVKEKIDRAIVP